MLEESLGAGLEEAARVIEDRLEEKVQRMIDRIEAERESQRIADHEECRAMVSRLSADIDEVKQTYAHLFQNGCGMELPNTRTDEHAAINEVICWLQSELGPSLTKVDEVAERNCRSVQEVWKGVESLQCSLDGEVRVLMALHDEQMQRVSRLQRDFVTFFGKVSYELGNDSCLSPTGVLDAMAAVSDSPRTLEVKTVEPTLKDTDVSCSFLPSRALKPSERQLSAERLSISASSPRAAATLHDCAEPMLNSSINLVLRTTVGERSPGAVMRSSYSVTSVCQVQTDGVEVAIFSPHCFVCDGKFLT
uniref:Uncharacterized protein n=1 Tax=Noctiluca scintillans TaxID=2966 RepID=A0A7S1AZ71_NOCSC